MVTDRNRWCSTCTPGRCASDHRERREQRNRLELDRPVRALPHVDVVGAERGLRVRIEQQVEQALLAHPDHLNVVLHVLGRAEPDVGVAPGGDVVAFARGEQAQSHQSAIGVHRRNTAWTKVHGNRLSGALHRAPGEDSVHIGLLAHRTPDHCRRHASDMTPNASTILS